jgi:hypothetical protein
MNARSNREKPGKPSLGSAKARPNEITVRPLSTSMRETPEFSADEATSMAVQAQAKLDKLDLVHLTGTQAIPGLNLA